MSDKRLRDLAKGAMHGPYYVNWFGVAIRSDDGLVATIADVEDCECCPTESGLAQAEYLAAVSPDAIVAIVEWIDTLVIQAESMAMALSQADEDLELDALGPVTATIVRQDIDRLLEIIEQRPEASK